VNGCGQTENNAAPCKTTDSRPIFLHFPRSFTLTLPRGAHLAFYGTAGPVTVMSWDSHCDSGWCLGTFADWPEAVAAGLVHQAEVVASYGGGAQ